MKTINTKKVTEEIQAMVNKGEITCMGENIVFHGKTGAYNVGTENDLVSAWNLIKAYQNAGK